MSLVNNMPDSLPVVDLSAILSQESQTVEKASFDIADTQVRAAYVASDFSDNNFDDDDETEVDDNNNTPSDTIESEPKKDSYFYKREAKRIVRLFDKGLKMGVPTLYKSLVLEPDDAVKLRKYRTYMNVQKNAGVTELVDKDDDILGVLERYERLNEMINGVALTEDETEDLVADLSEILKLRQKSFFSPEVSLAITCLVIVFARVEPVLSAKFKKMFS